MKYFKICLYSLIISIPVSAQNVISVLYFENTTQNEEYQWLSKGIADMLTSDLNGSPGINIIERESLEKILKEHALQLTGLMEDGPDMQIGKLLQADKLIYGAYIIANDNIRIDTKLTKVSTGQVLDAFKVEGEVEDIFLLQTELAGLVRKFLNVKQAPVAEFSQTNSIEALANFYTGLDHLDNKRYSEAQNAFQKSNEMDPLYYRAQKGLADSYKFLKEFKKYRQQNELTKLYRKINLLTDRLNASEWVTFADIVQSEEYRSMTPDQQQVFNKTHNEYLICNTPVQCMWHIMLTLDEIGRKSVEYFSDTELQKKLWRKIIIIGEDSEIKYAGDPFLPELLYIKILTLSYQKNYKQLKTDAEQFLISYPDYRMVETVEDYYETALNELNEIQH